MVPVCYRVNTSSSPDPLPVANSSSPPPYGCMCLYLPLSAFHHHPLWSLLVNCESLKLDPVGSKSQFLSTPGSLSVLWLAAGWHHVEFPQQPHQWLFPLAVSPLWQQPCGVFISKQQPQPWIPFTYWILLIITASQLPLITLLTVIIQQLHCHE